MRPINLELRSHLESNRDACGRETRWLVDGRARKAVICVSGKPASIRHDRHMCPAAVDTYRPKVCQQRQNHGHMPPEECDQFPILRVDGRRLTAQRTPRCSARHTL